MKWGWIALFLAMNVWGLSPDAIVKNVQHNLQSDSGYSKITMRVSTSRGERTMQLESWNRGNEKSFIKILYPKSESGITFLKIDTTMWQYVPKIEKTIKIPSSMMMQSWMGSDFTNDDMAKESSIVDDYIPSITVESTESYTLLLTPKPDAAVVWGKIVLEVAKEYFVPIKALYYDEDGILIRTLFYSDVKVYGTHHLPTRMTLIPVAKKSNRTVVLFEEVNFDAVIEDERFTMGALKRYSR